MMKIFRQILVFAVMAMISAGCGIKENDLPSAGNMENNGGGAAGYVDIDYRRYKCCESFCRAC